MEETMDFKWFSQIGEQKEIDGIFRKEYFVEDIIHKNTWKISHIKMAISYRMSLDVFSMDLPIFTLYISKLFLLFPL